MEPINILLGNMTGAQLIVFLVMCTLVVLALQIAMWGSMRRSEKRHAEIAAQEHAELRSMLMAILDPPASHAPPQSDPLPPQRGASEGLH